MGRPAFVRERILEAAFDRFARDGYEAVSTRDVATAAGVGAASMFKHFPTKEALGRALYTIALAPFLRDLAALEAGAPAPKAALTAFTALLYRAYDERPRMCALLVFPPHEFTPVELEPGNVQAPRNVLARLCRQDEDGTALLWGALAGPLQDRFLRQRTGPMSPHAAALAKRVATML
jgi:AcrR family transcriptional regulator